MKCLKIILPLFVFGVLVSSNTNLKSSKAVNAWYSYKSELGPDELETTFISEEIDTKGIYHYNYHIKNISEFYIHDFYIYGEYQLEDENFTRNQYDEFNIQNDLFNYKTLLIGPNQEVDVEFYLNNKYLDIDKVEVTAIGYDASINAQIAADVTLINNILSRSDNRVYLDIQNKDDNYYYNAILKATIDNEEYYFVASDKNDFYVYGNFVDRCNYDVEITLVRVIKIPNGQTGKIVDDYKERNSGKSIFSSVLFIIFWPIFLIIFCVVIVPIIIGICIFVRSVRNKRKITK